MGINTGNKKYDEMVSDIIENFDYEKCRITMIALNWMWAGRGIPNIEQMIDTSRSHLHLVIEELLTKENNVKPHEPYIVSSGGFRAWGYKNRHGRVEKLGLDFIVSEWDTE